jgi:23S rRNA (cytidine1920-2'-O)/16S rRNA (cytidine1409-2'-O)-methyltransferase
LHGVVSALTDDADIVALIKPQFEADRADAPRGVVRSPGTREAAVAKVTEYARSMGLATMGRITSPLRGPAGNVEFLVHLRTAAST